MAGEKPTREGLLYDFFVDEASRLGQRTDWFLIFHAILIEAFLSASDTSSKSPSGAVEVNDAHVIIIGLLGVVTAYLWFMSGCRQRWLLRHLGACMEHEPLMGSHVSELFGKLFKARREGLPSIIEWAQPVPTFAVIIPFAFTAAWMVLLVLNTHPRRVGLAYSSAAILLATVVTMWLRRGPVICDQFVRPLGEKAAPSAPAAQQ